MLRSFFLFNSKKITLHIQKRGILRAHNEAYMQIWNVYINVEGEGLTWPTNLVSRIVCVSGTRRRVAIETREVRSIPF